MPRYDDGSLYEGSAKHYLIGRMPYPARLGTMLAQRLHLNGRGRLLDLGCGPGSLTLLLAPLFANVVAVDPDLDMIRVGRAEASQRGIHNIDWQHSTAEDLTVNADQFTAVTLAQSWHWMDQPVVAAKIHRWLTREGTCVNIGATTHVGDPSATDLPHPAPPHNRIRSLVRRYVEPQQRAEHQGAPASPRNPYEDGTVFHEAGFTGPEIVSVRGGDTFIRTTDQIIDAVLSLSTSTPRLLGENLNAFTSDLHQLLTATSPDGLFAERLQDMRLFMWRPDRQQ